MVKRIKYGESVILVKAYPDQESEGPEGLTRVTVTIGDRQFSERAVMKERLIDCIEEQVSDAKKVVDAIAKVSVVEILTRLGFENE